MTALVHLAPYKPRLSPIHVRRTFMPTKPIERLLLPRGLCFFCQQQLSSADATFDTS